jgi:hypothetical protein
MRSRARSEAATRGDRLPLHEEYLCCRCDCCPPGCRRKRSFQVSSMSFLGAITGSSSPDSAGAGRRSAPPGPTLPPVPSQRMSRRSPRPPFPAAVGSSDPATTHPAPRTCAFCREAGDWWYVPKRQVPAAFCPGSPPLQLQSRPTVIFRRSSRPGDPAPSPTCVTTMMVGVPGVPGGSGRPSGCDHPDLAVTGPSCVEAQSRCDERALTAVGPCPPLTQLLAAGLGQLTARSVPRSARRPAASRLVSMREVPP